MCVDGHGYGGLGGIRDGVGGLYACGTKPEVDCSHVWRCLSTFEWDVML